MYGINISQEDFEPSKAKTKVDVNNGYTLMGPAWNHKGFIIILSDSNADWSSVSDKEGIIVEGESPYRQLLLVEGSQTFEQVIELINNQEFPLVSYLQIWSKDCFLFLAFS